MAIISYRQFKGEVPSLQPYLLQESYAQFAKNCEFQRGSLTSVRGGLLLSAMASNPVKGLYTQDGLLFYTWNSETIALRGPVITDSYNRMYFLRLSEGVLRATSTLNMATNGPTPLAENTVRVGVPRPTVAPVLTLTNRTTLPDYPGATVSFEVWFENGGTVYDKTAIAPGAFTPFKSYSFTQPTKSTTTPTDATIAIRMMVSDSTGQFINVTVRPGTLIRSQSLPGTQEYSLVNASTMVLSITWGPEDTRSYLYTLQNTWLEEGAPSPAATVSPTYLQDVNIAVAISDFTGLRPLQKYNLYRTFGTVETYMGVDYTGSAPSLVDSVRVASSVLGALPSTDWDPPPVGLQGATSMVGGIYAVFSGTELYLSEPYRPHAFPYIFSFQTAIRGICAAQQSLVVTTADGLYILAGANPSSAKVVKLSMPQPGIAQRSMANIDGGVVYASGDGVVMVEGVSASMDVSQRLFGRDQWRSLFGTILTDYSMRFSYQDGRLIATSSTTALGFLMRFDEDIGSFVRTDERYDTTFRLPTDDSLYYSSGNLVYKFQAGLAKPFDWWGKDYIFPVPSFMGAGYFKGVDSTLMLYCDGVLVYTRALVTGYFRLPGNLPRCLRMSVRLQGTGVVEELSLARTMSELKHV